MGLATPVDLPARSMATESTAPASIRYRQPPAVRIPLLSGSRLLVVEVDEGAVVLLPPPPTREPISDVGAAVRDALRFPLTGEPLEALVPRGRARATIVVEPPTLPLPGAPVDPRKEAIAATVSELRRLGVPDRHQTILVAAGLARRLGRRELERLFLPTFARSFRGRVLVHDVEDELLVRLGERDGVPLRAAPQLVETDLVVTVGAAETVLHGGPATLLSAGGPEALRAAGAASLLETSGSRGWQLALEMERALARRVPVMGVSLALDHPRVADTALGYPYDPGSLERLAGSLRRRLFRLLPGPARRGVIRSLPLSLSASAAFAGPPSVAHAEALLRAVEARSAALDLPLDVLCLGIPSATSFSPREPPNPLSAAYLGLGLALRLWRERPPVVEGGTVILAHRFRRHFAHPTQQPYRAFFQATRPGPDPELIAAAEREARADERALRDYRAGRSCHPLLPFRDWDACRLQKERLGAVLVAGCRDAAGARQLGLVPVHGLGAALDMARELAGPQGRLGFLVAPPYFPLRVKGEEPA